MFSPGCARLATKPGPDRIRGHDNDRNRARHLLQDRDHAAAGGDDGVGFALHEACGVAAHEFHIVGRPALVEFDFAAFRPPKSLEFLFERAHPRLYVRLSFRVGHQESDAPHPLARYLRARRERPRHRCAAEQRDELAAL
jgi:hypothetical protein